MLKIIDGEPSPCKSRSFDDRMWLRRGISYATIGCCCGMIEVALKCFYKSCNPCLFVLYVVKFNIRSWWRIWYWKNYLCNWLSGIRFSGPLNLSWMHINPWNNHLPVSALQTIGEVHTWVIPATTRWWVLKSSSSRALKEASANWISKKMFGTDGVHHKYLVTW